MKANIKITFVPLYSGCSLLFWRMESDEEAFIETEIQKGLDKLTEADLESSDNSASDALNNDNSSSEDVNEV